MSPPYALTTTVSPSIATEWPPNQSSSAASRPSAWPARRTWPRRRAEGGKHRRHPRWSRLRPRLCCRRWPRRRRRGRPMRVSAAVSSISVCVASHWSCGRRRPSPIGSRRRRRRGTRPRWCRRRSPRTCRNMPPLWVRGRQLGQLDVRGAAVGRAEDVDRARLPRSSSPMTTVLPSMATDLPTSSSAAASAPQA